MSMHLLSSWEIDASQPRIASGLISRLRTYTGVKGMHRKLSRLLTDFEFLTLTAAFGPPDYTVLSRSN